ncbi:CopG family transcriptional regulator [Candidatus Woesearchaeota archaeon]|nr:CopG family transcriptional regulator [Candidatus Woesearchaeota archaeon]
MAKNNESNTTQVSIPAELAKKIEIRCKETGFDSLSSYVTFVLRQLMAGVDPQRKQVYSKEEKKKVSDRLKGLGYLD